MFYTPNKKVHINIKYNMYFWHIISAYVKN